MSQELLNILNDLLKSKSYNDIAKELNIASGTVKRWNELNNVPPAYCCELMKLAQNTYYRFFFPSTVEIKILAVVKIMRILN